MKNRMCIVFSTNRVFAVYTYIAIFTMLEKASREYNYEIKIFITDCKKKEKDMLESLSCEFASVTCMDVSKYVEGIDLRGINHISKETFYRLFIPTILPDYERVVYLDSDIIVLGDISKLMDIEMGNSPIAGTKDVVTDYIKKHASNIGMNDARNMFNSGVMIINTKEYEKRGIKEKAIELIYKDYENDKRKYQFPDQDILNVLLEGEIKIIDPRWNVLAYFGDSIEEILCEKDREDYRSYLDAPYIVHFAGPRKPWNDEKLLFAETFWDKAKEAGVFFEILGRVIGQKNTNSDLLNCFKGFRFPFELVPPNSKVAIYGAGIVGRDFYFQLELTLYAEVVVWVDKNYKEIDKKYKVSPVETLISQNDRFDFVVISIENGSVADNIKNTLIESGISPSKIVWGNYAR